jgi:hypothetical protein
MQKIIGACVAAALITFVGMARGAEAAPSYALTVIAGQSVTVPVPGVVRAETNLPELVEVVTGTDEVTVRGIRTGQATLILSMPDGIEARPIHVAPAVSGQIAAPVSGGGCLDRSYISADAAHLALNIPSFEADWAPGNWHLSWSPSDAHVLASSALITPLQQLGVPAVPGVQVLWDNGWGFIASNAMNLVGYKVPGGGGTIMFGDSALGPAGEVEASLGDFTLSTAAIVSPSGQILNTAGTSLNVGPVTLGYTTGLGGGSPSMQVRAGPVTVSAGATPSQGVQVGLGSSLAGVNFQGLWTAAGGWRAQIGMTLGTGPAQPQQDPCKNAH